MMLTTSVVRENQELGLVEPFETGDGSLRGVNAEFAFGLGVQWAMFRQKLVRNVPFTTLCLAENRGRFVRMAERHGRFVEDRPTTWPGWVEIWVGDAIA